MANHTPEARPRRDGTVAWRVRFRLNGRLQARTFTSEPGARQFADLLTKIGTAEAVRVLDARVAAAGQDVPTVARAATDHIEALSGVEAGTRRRYTECSL